MNPTSSLYSTLAYRYGLAIGNSYGAEIFAIVVWSRCDVVVFTAVEKIDSCFSPAHRSLPDSRQQVLHET